MRVVRRQSSARRGAALLAALVVVLILAIVAGVGLTYTQTVKNEAVEARDRVRALYLAEAGVKESLAMLTSTLATGERPQAAVGTRDAPRTRKSGSYWADVVDNRDGTFTVTATGQVADERRSVEVILLRGGAQDDPEPSGPPTRGRYGVVAWREVAVR